MHFRLIIKLVLVAKLFLHQNYVNMLHLHEIVHVAYLHDFGGLYPQIQIPAPFSDYCTCLVTTVYGNLMLNDGNIHMDLAY